MIVIGAPNSSNSQRLREVAERAGCPVSLLVQRAGDLDWQRLAGIRRVGITAGASAPEVLVEEVIDAFAERYAVSVEVVTAADGSGRLQPAAGAARSRPDRHSPVASRRAASCDQAVSEPATSDSWRSTPKSPTTNSTPS